VGLAKSISELNIKITEYKSELEGKSKEFQQVDSLIANRLKPVHELHHENLAKFLRLKEDMGQVSILEFEISEHKKKSEDLNAKLKEKVITLPPKVIPENVYTELSDEIKRILVSWGIDCKDLYYDDKDCDIVINGDKRVNSGKGYRGLYLSAFMIGALLFSLKKNRPHPNFLVLDSPLTAFMEKDKSRVSESDDAIPMEIQDKFYESLATLPQRNNLQIIIIENKEPNATILEKIKHEHFTKNEEIGRYGFYP
jgi:hypothetical protein